MNDLARHVSQKLGDVLDLSSLSAIPVGAFKTVVADATMPFQIKGKHAKDDVVLLVSNSDFDGVVEDDIAMAQSVRDIVDGETGAQIVRPKLSGKWGTQSYAVFERHHAFSQNRALATFQKVMIAPVLRDWCAQLALQTKQHWADDDAYDRRFRAPLRHLVQDHDCPSALRRFAENRLANTRTDQWTCIEHGDLWLGNVLLTRKFPNPFAPSDFNIRVIDWRGANVQGYPGADIVRFVRSLCGRPGRLRSKWVGQILGQYRATLEMTPTDMAENVALSLGVLGQDLGCFPRDRYCDMRRDTTGFLRSQGMLGDI
ncbi:hypothetical protein [Aestuariibius sp. HNIBRBA575]|uniref:hypothetical protein n=1 Tax=Aestuariibius sp. HNIBRBA575 TaxID=3233343 RepID=UPI0034A44AE7